MGEEEKAVIQCVLYAHSWFRLSLQFETDAFTEAGVKAENNKMSLVKWPNVEWQMAGNSFL